jgi:hypothetical protein
MKKTDLAYIAGIIDGEGCITLKVNRVGASPEQRMGFYELEVQVSNTNQWLIEWLFFNFGGKIREEKKKDGCKQAWRWIIMARKAADFLKLIYPYLRLKHPQAELGLRFQGKRRNNYGRKGKSISERILDEADKILMSKYNQKGDSEVSTLADAITQN